MFLYGHSDRHKLSVCDWITTLIFLALQDSKDEIIVNDWTNTLKSGDIWLWQWRFQLYGVTISIRTLTISVSSHDSPLTTKRNPENKENSVPIRKWRGFSSYFLTTLPLKNLLPKRSGVMKVPYLAIPISYGLNSTQSVS